MCNSCSIAVSAVIRRWLDGARSASRVKVGVQVGAKTKQKKAGPVREQTCTCSNVIKWLTKLQSRV